MSSITPAAKSNKLKRHAPEILVGLTVLAGIGASWYIKKSLDVPEVLISLEGTVGPIMVLEEVADNVWQNLDTNVQYAMTLIQ